SSLQGLRPAQRWPIAEALLSRGEDAGDANLPLMIWYGIEPLVNEDADRFVKLAGGARIPLVRRHIARRTAFAAASGEGLVSLVQLLGSADSEIQQDLLDGMLLGLEGRRRFEMPSGWAPVFATLRQNSRTEIREDALELALIFDDPVALKTIHDEAGDARLDR